MLILDATTQLFSDAQRSFACAECTSVMTSRSVVLDLGIPVVQPSDALQYKSQSPMRRSCSSNSIVSACDHFEFYKESY